MSQVQLPLSGVTGHLTRMAWSPHGQTLPAGSNDHLVRLWDLDPELLLDPGSTPAGGATTRAGRQPGSVFISYSHNDQRWVERLQLMVKPFARTHGSATWADSQIKAGELWREEIEKAIASAAVAVLFVSPDFLASDFVMDNELPDILKRAEARGVRILWKPVRFSTWTMTSIEKFQAVGKVDQPLESLVDSDADRALVELAEEIVRAVDAASSSTQQSR